MTFSDKQRRAFNTQIKKRHVRSRVLKGTQLNYVAGWHVIAEANRIFGHDAWDRVTTQPTKVWSERRRGVFHCLYTAKVRITVRAGPAQITRDGIGSGLGRSEDEENAIEMGIKAAETDATKRALATFGKPFGLSLYESTQPGPSATTPSNPQTLQLRLITDETRDFQNADDLAGAILKTIPTLNTLHDVYAFWEANLSGLLAIKVSKTRDVTVDKILETLKRRGREVANHPGKHNGKATPHPNGAPSREDQEANDRIKIAKAAIASVEKEQATRCRPRPKERRIRDKMHLAWVARHPCLICGRTPTHAHHLKFAQPRAMSLKVSDEFTVPLCPGHHDAVHKTGDEPAWWARHGIEPLKVAERLWRAPDKTTAADLDPLITKREPTRSPDPKHTCEETRPIPQSRNPGTSPVLD